MQRTLYNVVKSINPRAASLFIIFFYFVGLVGFIWPVSHHLFLILSKWALLMSIGFLIWFHPGKFSLKTLIVYFAIFISSFLIEAIGVQTGSIFGAYTYSHGLGIKIFQTPLMIGLNWLMLSYCFVSITHPLKVNAFIKIIMGAAGMLLYDIVMEQVAPFLEMWHWAGNNIPIQNYIAWFIIALLMQSMLIFSKTTHRNPLAKTIILSQSIFFLCLLVYKNIIL